MKALLRLSYSSFLLVDDQDTAALLGILSRAKYVERDGGYDAKEFKENKDEVPEVIFVRDFKLNELKDES